MDILTSNCMLHLFLDASGHMDDFSMCTLGHILVAVSAASWWTDWCLHSCSVPMSDVLDLVPVNQLELDPLPPGGAGCVSMICWCGIGEGDDNERKWEGWRTI